MFITARSALPSLLKSAVLILPGASPTLTVEVAKLRELEDLVIVNGTAFDVPPPGAGLKTVIEAVPGDATFEAGTFATSLLELINAVCSGIPSHFTTEVGTNPVPLKVKVRSGEPGSTLVGTSGWYSIGIGLADCARSVEETRTIKSKCERLAGMVLLPTGGGPIGQITSLFPRSANAAGALGVSHSGTLAVRWGKDRTPQHSMLFAGKK